MTVWCQCVSALSFQLQWSSVSPHYVKYVVCDGHLRGALVDTNTFTGSTIVTQSSSEYYPVGCIVCSLLLFSTCSLRKESRSHNSIASTSSLVEDSGAHSVFWLTVLCLNWRRPISLKVCIEVMTLWLVAIFVPAHAMSSQVVSMSRRLTWVPVRFQ